LGSIADDWKKSLQDTKDVDTLILESDPAQLRTDLERESELLAAFLAVFDGSPDPAIHGETPFSSRRRRTGGATGRVTSLRGSCASNDARRHCLG
jgi:hypothetical protein